MVGRWIAPNLTSGEGSVTKGFTANDWDRAVRHGVRHNGRTSSMPVIEFLNLTDHEMSDIVAYVRSMPPVNRDLGPVKFGPVFSFMIATDPKALMAREKDVNAAVYEVVGRLHGSISAEHGIGQLKSALLKQVKDPVALEMMRAVKQALDPNGILNPGKLLG